MNTDILDRLRLVAGRPDDRELLRLVESSLNAARFEHARNLLLTALSTEAEEERRWPFMINVKGSAARCIEVSRRILEKHLQERFGIDRPNWQAVDTLAPRSTDRKTEARKRIADRLSQDTANA